MRFPYPRSTVPCLTTGRRFGLGSHRRRRGVYACGMSIAITEDHRALAETVSSFLTKHQSRTAARSLLEAPEEPNPSFYADAADLGWLGLHVPEELGGSGFGLEEVVVVVEGLGHHD